MSKEKKLPQLRAMYVGGLLTLSASARASGVSSQTALRWKKKALEQGDDWERSRVASATGGEGRKLLTQGLISHFIRLHQEAMDKLEEDEEIHSLERVKAVATLAAAFSKTMNAASRADPSLSRLAVAHDVLERLADFVIAEFPQEGETFLQILRPFSKHLSEAYG